MAGHYSDLQVVYNPVPPEPLYPGRIAVGHYQSGLENKSREVKPTATATKERICGLRSKVFWTAVILSTLTIVGAIAVGITQVLASHQRPHAEESTSTPLGNPVSGTPTSSIPVSITTIVEIGPTETLYRDCPSSNNTIYQSLGSAEFQFRKLCSVAFQSRANNVVSKKTASLSDCIDQCTAYNVENKSELATKQGSVCSSVCWINTLNNNNPGQCFGSTTYNSSIGELPLQPDHAECDSAIWINQNIG
ncbi:hypothetical protein GQ53DRAFT_861449 [Thozetella sp. PMI_491]|nr:hypothetical protein GQ53DRAFT_861449 [Thozetella sp. PMI_491]